VSFSLAEGVLAGQTTAIARMITSVEAGGEGIADQVEAIYRAGGHAFLLGVTGSPGSGKSTLVAAITGVLRKRSKRVGIVAIDPTSPYSGGAILGDRIRMGVFTGDPGVFIRSMATRGAMGGLARAATDAVAVLDAAGFDVVMIETVGVGQDEVDVVRASHTTLVISTPGMGDDIQAIKAGVIEIADIHVVNKADREGASRTVAELKTMLNFAGPTKAGEWKAPVLATVAETGQGVPELIDKMLEHRAWQERSGNLEVRERKMAADRIRSIATGILLDGILDPTRNDGFEVAVEQVRKREVDPFTAARQLIEGVVAR
jgi:LAO/AO transport system kinase